MSRRKRLNAVATTALVAAFPVFPLVADEPTPSNDAAPQAVAPADAASVAETPAPPNVNDEFADFNVSLFEIPDGESTEFYRKRVDEIEREWERFVESFGKKQEEFARQTQPNAAFNQASKLVYAPIGTIPVDGRFVPASADSVPGRRAAALVDLYGRLANAPESPLETRGRYYANWLRALGGPLAGKPAVEYRDFYAKILADEEAKSPLDLARIFKLRALVEQYDSLVQNDAKSRRDDELQKPNDRADVEKLLDVPEGESSDYYQTLVRALDYAVLIARKEKDETFETSVREAFDLALKRRQEALKAEAAALDRTVAEKLLDVPKGETAAFYLARYEETENVERQLTKYLQYREPRDLDALTLRLRGQTLPEIAKRLAYADDLEPLERFSWLQRWLRSLDVERLRDALDAEIARGATSEIDRLRELRVRKALAEKRIDEAREAARRTLPQSKRTIFDGSSLPSVDEETREKFYVAFAEIAELADGGAIPWTLGSTWATWAANLADRLQHEVELELATRLRKDIRDALADSENETDRGVLRDLERQIRADEIIGAEIPVEGRNSDGTPFDWASYRGAPVLLVAERFEPTWAPNGDPRFISKRVEEGELKIVYYCSDLASAQREARDRQELQTAKERGLTAPRDLALSPPIAAFVAPVEGKEGVPGDWPYEYGIGWRRFGVLFDADGRVLATSPGLPISAAKTRQIADELLRLFPDGADENVK